MLPTFFVLNAVNLPTCQLANLPTDARLDAPGECGIISGMVPTRLHLLGVPTFSHGAEPAELTTAKGVALLAYLALTPMPQSRERLIDLLWPDSLPDAARKNLRNALWAIRKALGEAALTTDNDRLALSDGVWVDVREWERLSADPAPDALAAAVACYRGSLLDGWALNDAPDFELWLTSERERLARQHQRVLEALVAHHRQAREWEAILPLARQALRDDPLQEPMHRALMEAHARLGQRAEALRQYESLHDTLARELGVEPLPDSVALRDAILSGQVSAPPAPPPPRRPPILGEPPSAPFVGRAAERAALAAEMQSAATGRARVLLLVGEVGIGKSRLWREWAATLPPDQPVLEVRCLDTMQALPLAPLAELLRTPACARRLTAPGSPVAPVWLAALARLLPELTTQRPDLLPLAPLPPEEERHRLFEALTQSLLALGSSPLVLFVDDVHWADQATLDWLVYLVHRLRAEALLLVLAYRPEESPAALEQMVAGWARQGVSRTLPLAPLTQAEAAHLLTSLGSDPERAEQACMQSAGNPYFLTELAQAAPGDAPPALADLIGARLARLPEMARQSVQAAAILAPDFGFATLRRTSGRGDEETLDALDTLLDARLLVERGGRYRFAHPFAAAVVRQEMSAARRAFLHRRAAEAREPTLPMPQGASLLATHFAEAGNPARAAHYAEIAARQALVVAAPTEAVNFFRRALALEESPARSLGLGEALLWQGDLVGAQAAFEAARRGFEAAGERREAARAGFNLAESFIPAGRIEEALRAVEEALRLLDEEDPADRARAHFLLAVGSLDVHGSFAEAEGHLDEAFRLAQESHQPALAARGRFTLGNLRAERGDLPAARAAFAEAIALAHEAGDPFQAVLGYNNAAYHALLDGDMEVARVAITQGLALAGAQALRVPLQYLYSTRGEIALAEGQWEEARGWFERGLDEAQTNRNPRQIATCYLNLALVARGQGDLAAALPLLEMARAEVAALPQPHLQAQIDLWLAQLHQEQQDEAAARVALARAQARLAGSERHALRGWAERLGARF